MSTTATTAAAAAAAASEEMISIYTERPERKEEEGPPLSPKPFRANRAMCERYSEFFRNALEMDGGKDVILDANANIRPSVLADVLAFLKIWDENPEKHDLLTARIKSNEANPPPGNFCPDFLVRYCSDLDCNIRQAIAILKAADFLIIEPLQTLLVRYIADLAVYLPYDVLVQKLSACNSNDKNNGKYEESEIDP